MNRHELFLFELQTLICASGDSDNKKILKSIAGANDPNVKTMIMGGTDQTVEQKVYDYYTYCFENGPKPFWFVLSTE